MDDKIEEIAASDAAFLRSLAREWYGDNQTPLGQRLERIAATLTQSSVQTEEEAYARREIREACKPTGEDHRRY